MAARDGFSKFLPGRYWMLWPVAWVVLTLACAPVQAQTVHIDHASKRGEDTITFRNGDTLTGKVGKVVYGNVSFPATNWET
jgi:hypothetical protein